MNAEELVQELRNLNSPNLQIYIPCPHCCGQPGTDFEMLDAEFVVTMEKDGRQVVLLGDPGREALNDRRLDNNLRIRRKVTQGAPVVAHELGLNYVGITGWETLREVAESRDSGQSLLRQLRNLRRSVLVIEATDGNDTHYIIVETSFRAFQEDVDRLQRNSEIVAAITGCAARSVIACVKRDSSLDGRELPPDIHWHMVDEADLDAE